MKNNNVYLTKLADKISPKLLTIEGILSFTTLLGMILKASNVQQGSILIIISLSAIALVYYISAFRTCEEGANVMGKFLTKLMFLSASISIIGILFLLQGYAGYKAMLTVGCLSIVIVLLFRFIYKTNINRINITRVIVILAIAASLYFTPKEKLREYKIISNIEVVKAP